MCVQKTTYMYMITYLSTNESILIDTSEAISSEIQGNLCILNNCLDNVIIKFHITDKFKILVRTCFPICPQCIY